MCDLDCLHCRLPAEACHGGTTHRTPYTDRSQQPVHGRKTPGTSTGVHTAAGTGKRCGEKHWEGWSNH